MSNATVQQSGLDKKVPWLLFLDNFAQGLGIAVTLTFMNMFMTNFLMMTPIAVAGILTVGRLVDLFVSMISGSIVQKGNLKTGPLRTYILINGPLLAVGNFLIFLNPDVSPQMKTVLFLIGYYFRNLPQSFLITASNALVPKVAGANMQDRMALTARKMQGSNSCTIFTSFLTVTLTTYFNERLGPGKGYLVTSLLYCAVHSIIGLIVYIGLAPYDKYDPDLKKVEGSSANVKVTHMYADTLKNPQVWILALAGIIAQIAGFTMSPLIAYYYTYVLGNMQYMTLNNTTGSFVGLAVSFLAPPIARRLGKKNSILVSQLGTIIGQLGIFLFTKGNFWVFFAFGIWNRIIMGPAGSIGINLWVDAAEYQLYKTGRDSRPFIMSINSICMKIGQMISSYTYAWVLTYCNFTALGEGKVDLDPAKLHQGLYGFLLACYACTFLLYLSFGINEAKSKEYAEANKKMLEERAAAGAAS
ncbi:MAG: MFS transporter [Eubacteriaceae bacterium]|nr:MFS transporter [Eubacteriaceae bacterium]